MKDAASRITATEALAHRWFHGDADDTPILANVIKNLQEFTSNNTFKNVHRFLLRLLASASEIV